jgi:epoxyqueuosine reductase
MRTPLPPSITLGSRETPKLPDWLTHLANHLAQCGLNTFGIAAADVGAPLPGARSVVVFASGGPALWEAFGNHLRAHPEALQNEEHPLDRFIAGAILAAPPPPSAHRWIRCAADEPDFLDFRPLAAAAGLGWASRTGLLLHPQHGLWIGLRAALFTEEVLPISGPLPGPGPCAACAASCVRACPVEAVPTGPFTPSTRFQIQKCAAHRTGDGCPTECGARAACPEGTASRYSTLEVLYHHDREKGRPALAHSLGITEVGRGTGPHWHRWA